MPGIFSLTSSEQLFEILADDYCAFCFEPNEKGLIKVIFPMYHLREWIHPAGHTSRSREDALPDEERLYTTLHHLSEYQVVRDLCNSAKHYAIRRGARDTEILHGFRAGLGRAGDSLDVMHFLAEGIEIRSIFDPVFTVYLNYFKKKCPLLVERLSQERSGG